MHSGVLSEQITMALEGFHNDLTIDNGLQAGKRKTESIPKWYQMRFIKVWGFW